MTSRTVKRSLAVFIALSSAVGCTGQRPMERLFLSEDQLTHNNYARGYLTACALEDEKYANTCFTSRQALGKDPIEVLHVRFLEARSTMDNSDTTEANRSAMCTVGILLSCELVDLLREHGYSRDSDVIYKLHLLLSGSMDSFLERKIPKSELYPSNYDPQKSEHFRRVLQRSIEELKRNDPNWRRSW